jgi:hypothetical protein
VLLGHRLFLRLTSAALIGRRQFFKPNKIAGTSMPAPTRKKQIGSAGTTHHIGFCPQLAPGPSWQTNTAVSPYFASHPFQIAISTDHRCLVPVRLLPALQQRHLPSTAAAASTRFAAHPTTGCRCHHLCLPRPQGVW